MSNLTSLVQGVSQSLNSYLQAGQQQGRQQQNAAFDNQLKQQDMQMQSDLSVQSNKAEQENSIDLAGKVTPDFAMKTFGALSPEFGQAAAKAADEFQKQNNRYMTLDEANKALDPILKALDASQNSKNNTKHYLGNDPKGNAIFADGKGQMFSPDGGLYAGVVLPKSSTMPTSQARSSGEFASTLLPHITEMRQLIEQADQKGFIGPAAGRVYSQFMAGKIGSTGDQEADLLLGRLRAMDSLMKTGAMKAHFGSRGGQNMYEHFSDLLNTGKQSKAILNGSLDTLEQFMQGYEQAGKPQQEISGSKPAANKDPLGIL